MTATANTEFSIPRGSLSFFWTMIALAVLDVILLFWILNPLSKPLSNSTGFVPAQERISQPQDGVKPSPLGGIASNRR